MVLLIITSVGEAVVPANMIPIFKKNLYLSWYPSLFNFMICELEIIIMKVDLELLRHKLATFSSIVYPKSVLIRGKPRPEEFSRISFFQNINWTVIGISYFYP